MVITPLVGAGENNLWGHRLVQPRILTKSIETHLRLSMLLNLFKERHATELCCFFSTTPATANRCHAFATPCPILLPLLHLDHCLAMGTGPYISLLPVAQVAIVQEISCALRVRCANDHAHRAPSRGFGSYGAMGNRFAISSCSSMRAFTRSASLRYE